MSDELQKSLDLALERERFLREALSWYVYNDESVFGQDDAYYAGGRRRALDALGLEGFIEPLRDLLVDSSFRVLSFRELPQSAKLAVAHYMSVDGAAWAVSHPSFPDWEWGEGTPADPAMREKMLLDLDVFMPRFVEAFGHVLFGYAVVQTNRLANIIHASHPDFDGSKIPAVKRGEYDVPTWASILSDDEQILQDGWTRFYDRLALGISRTPVVWYV